MKRMITGECGGERRVLSGMGFLVMGALLAGCSGPMLVTEYEDGMEVGEETVVYDSKGHPVVTSEHGYVDNPYAEPYSVPKEDLRRNDSGLLPDY